ncbi:unnamed protein product [Cutaneotrichosporon oleaginosum]
MPWLERERGRGERRGRDQEGDTIPRSCRLSSTPLSLPVGTSPYALVAHFRHKAWIPLSFCSLRVISYTTLPSSLSRRRSPLRSHRGVFRAVRPLCDVATLHLGASWKKQGQAECRLGCHLSRTLDEAEDGGGGGGGATCTDRLASARARASGIGLAWAGPRPKVNNHERAAPGTPPYAVRRV